MSNQTTKVTVEQKESRLEFVKCTDRYNWSNGVNLAQEAKRSRSEQELRTLTALLYDIPEERVEVIMPPAKPTVLIKVSKTGHHIHIQVELWHCLVGIGHEYTVAVPNCRHTDDQFKAIVRAVLAPTGFPFDEAEVTVERVP